jgi:hypothetical protein
MTRLIRVCGTAILSALSAFGASQLALLLGLGPAVATLASIVAFLCNFSMLTEQGHRNLLGDRSLRLRGRRDSGLASPQHPSQRHKIG